MNPVNFGDTWSRERNPHPDALSLKDLVGKRCIIWEIKNVDLDGMQYRRYLLIGESEKDAVWYEDGKQLKRDHGHHVTMELIHGNKPVIATVRKKWLYGLYFE